MLDLCNDTNIQNLQRGAYLALFLCTSCLLSYARDVRIIKLMEVHFVMKTKELIALLERNV